MCFPIGRWRDGGWRKLSGVSLAWMLPHAGCLCWRSVDLMFSEEAPFCYNRTPEGEPTASSAAPFSQQPSVPSAGENLAMLDLVRHNGCVAFRAPMLCRSAPPPPPFSSMLCWHTSAFVSAMKIAIKVTLSCFTVKLGPHRFCRSFWGSGVRARQRHSEFYPVPVSSFEPLRY